MNEFDGSRADSPDRASRRDLLRAAAGAAVLGLGSGAQTVKAATMTEQASAIKNGRIKQSIVHWCFEPYWNIDEFIKQAKALGCTSIELVPPQYFPKLKEAGLTNAIGQIDMSPDPPFMRGFNNPKHWDKVIKATTDAIDACSEYGYKNVICFTGYADGLSAEQGAANCVEGFKKIVGHAEKKNVVLCLEMLNSRVDDHPMKGHPGYQGDHTDYCIDIIKRVDSPNLKLLYDFYHVQIMDGDLIKRLRQHRRYIGHIHTAGNPGRCELDANQEIQYPALMKALLEIGYEGHVGHEFIPTRDPLEGLREAVALCDV
ncbi:hydroxypyruvate isomerase family protein [Paludisphaera borealis]|uniref:Hydroxypyruvate isomerase n=1 Tax=Paludisphaera borealis TaxID=1387353 RepID=A0A1U7CLT6_9BACT|nr:TIM barrel protein [Paludisphaera borealis]APW59868.1 Hydroxypyruvate isomerase [Paludisphaera borealis]